MSIAVRLRVGTPTRRWVRLGGCRYASARGAHLRQARIPSGSIHLRIWESVSGSTQAQGRAFPATSHPAT
jgi:hypothetical protein